MWIDETNEEISVLSDTDSWVTSPIPKTGIIEWLKNNNDENDIDVLVTAIRKLEDEDHIKQFIIEYVPYSKKSYPVQLGEEQYLSAVTNVIRDTVFLSTMDGDIKNIWFSVLADLLQDMWDKNIAWKKNLQLDE